MKYSAKRFHDGFPFTICLDVCLPGWENTISPGPTASCQRCETNEVNPVVGGDCVACNETMISNDDNTLCGRFQ